MENVQKTSAPDEFDLYIFIIHGVEGYPDKNWYPALKERLESIFTEAGIKVKIDIPQFPTQLPESVTSSCEYELTYINQRYEYWEKIMDDKMVGIDPSKVEFGAHSMGGAFAAKYVAKLGKEGTPCLGLHLVSAVGAHIDGLDRDCYVHFDSFTGVNGADVIMGARFRSAYVGKNDQDVPPQQTIDLAMSCGVCKDDIKEYENGQHLNALTDPEIIRQLVENIAWKMAAEAYEKPEISHKCIPLETLKERMGYRPRSTKPESRMPPFAL